MSNFSEIVLMTHVLFGMLCIVTGLWVFVDTLNASDTNQTRIRGLSVAVAVLMWLAYLIGGYWYATLHSTDKALLLKGPWPFAHTFFMEMREHVVLILLLLATYLPIAASSNLSANKSARSKEAFMNASYHRAAAVIGLVLILGGTTVWGAQPPNNDVSDNSGNTAGGSGALVTLGTGSDNTAFGYLALLYNTTGNNNTASGAFALQNNTTGGGNTASGSFALRSNTGDDNTAIGMNAGLNLKSGNSNIYLGNNQGAATESKTMRLGSAQTRTFVAGIAGTPINGSTVVIASNGQLGTIVSSARYKEHIQDMGERSRQVLLLRPVTFQYKQDSEGSKQYGLIAEEVDQVYPELVTHTATGEPESVQYHALIAMLLNELQHQQQQIGEQTRQLTVQAQQIAAVEAQSAALADRLMQLEEKQTAGALTLTSR